MSEADPKLEAFPIWAMGQVLLPVQFDALQRALLSQIAVRAELQGLPAYGLSRLKLRTLVNEGSVAIERLTYFPRRPFPVIDIPGNTTVNDLNVSDQVDALEEGKSLPVYLHLLHAEGDSRESKQGRYIEDDPVLGRTMQRAELSLDSAHENARMAGIRLFELERVNEQWRLADFAPALTRVGGASSPFLDDMFRSLLATLRVVNGQVEQNIKDESLNREHASEQRRVRASARRLLAYFKDLGIGGEPQSSLSVHPFVLFRELRDFYIETASNLEHPPRETPAYDHDRLHLAFDQLNTLIDELELTTSLSSKSLKFERDADNYTLSKLPNSLAETKDVFLIIKFGSDGSRPVGEEDTAAFLDQFKIASPKEVDRLIAFSLPGLGLEALGETAGAIFAPKFGSSAFPCRLLVEGDPLWAKVHEEDSLRIPITEGLDYLTLYLVWSERAKEGT